MRSFIYNDNNVDYHRVVVKYSVGVLIACLALVAFYKFGPFVPSSTFAKDKYYFSSSIYCKEVNELLKRSLDENGTGNTDIGPLLKKHSTGIFRIGNLVFCVMSGNSGHEMRLVGIEGFSNPADSLFYYNSLLLDHIQLQNKYINREIFRVQLRNSNNATHISSITIDDNVLSVPLISDNAFWNGKVVANTDALFPGSLFIKCADAWLPLCDYDRFVSNPAGVAPDATIDFINHPSQLSIVNDVVLNGKRVFDVRFRNINIRFMKLRDTLYLYSDKIGDVHVMHMHSNINFAIRDDDKIRIPLNGQPFEIKFTRLLQSNFGPIYCTHENPLNDISFMSFHNRANFRFAASPNNVDIFSATISRKIPEIENVYYELKQNNNNNNNNSRYKLSYNPILGKYLEEEIKNYLTHDPFLTPYCNPKDSIRSVRMAMTLMNTATGEILAAPWYSKQDDCNENYVDRTNFNFVNHPIGSCFKPLLYMASFRRYPALSKLSLTNGMVDDYRNFDRKHKHEDVSILGYKTKSFYGDTKGPPENLTKALAKSSNLYPAIVFLYSITENHAEYESRMRNISTIPMCLNNSNPPIHSSAVSIGSNGNLYLNRLNSNDISDIYKKLYDVEDINLLIGDRDVYEYGYWNSSYKPSGSSRANHKLNNYGPISPQRVTLRFDAFNNTEKELGGNFTTEVVPWILGSQNNWWNNIKLCEAYCRVVTGMNIRGSFYSQPTANSLQPLFNVTDSILSRSPSMAEFQVAHKDLLNAMEFTNQKNSCEGGSWKDIGTMVNNIRIRGLSTDSNFVIFAKTGTPADFKVNGKSTHRGGFAFTIMTQAQYEQLKDFIDNGYDRNLFPERLGISGVIFLELTDERGDEQGTTDEIYSVYAKHFLTEENLKNILLFTNSLF